MNTERYFTPPQLAKLWRCKPERVIAMIRRGELRAFSLSPVGSRRPRWRISPDAVTEFENRHTARPPAVPVRRSNRKPSGVIQFIKP